MSKGYVIIKLDDIPDSCKECIYKASNETSCVCVFTFHDVNNFERPKSCPIRSIPSKKVDWDVPIIHGESFDLGLSYGWNKCLKTIFKGE